MRGLRFGALAAALLVSTAASLPAREETATVVRVIDGDTIEVSIAGQIEKVRLIGVDTPETVDPRKPVEAFGKEASAFTKTLVEGKEVVLRDELGGQDRDKYSRLLRYVYLEDGTFVNAEIIKQGYGHAYVAFPFSHMDEFRAYERQAREKGLGLWKGKDIGAEPEQALAPKVGPFVGSAKSDKYHLPDCVWAQKISPTRLVIFESPEEAQSRGYSPCEICNPPAGSRATRRGRASSGASRALNEYNFYLALVDRKVRAAWQKPTSPQQLEGGERLAAVVTLTLNSSGRVASLDLMRPSGNQTLDDSALRAVREAEPFPPFPYQLARHTLTLNLEFVLTSEAE